MSELFFIPDVLRPWIWGFVFVLGLCVGSFLNVVGLRFLKDESIVHPASHCPECKTPLTAWDNIPVISYLILRGKCRTCKTPISIQYPLIELLTAGLFTWTVYEFGVTWQSLFIVYLMANLVVIIITDWRESFIFDYNSIWLVPAGLLYSYFNLGGYPGEPWQFSLLGLDLSIPAALGSSLLALAVAFFFFEGFSTLAKFIFGSEGYGRGDTFMMMGVGSFVGWELVSVAIFLGLILQVLPVFPVIVYDWWRAKEFTAIGFLLGSVSFAMLPLILPSMGFPIELQLILHLGSSVVAVILLLGLIKRLKDIGTLRYMPLGPALAMGTMIVVFGGQPILNYLHGIFSGTPHRTVH